MYSSVHQFVVSALSGYKNGVHGKEMDVSSEDISLESCSTSSVGSRDGSVVD